MFLACGEACDFSEPEGLRDSRTSPDRRTEERTGARRMSRRGSGWRTWRARHAQMSSAVAASAPATLDAKLGGGSAAAPTSLASPEERVRWTLGFVAVLAYIFSVTSYRVNIATPAMVIAVIALFFEGKAIRFPPFLFFFALWVIWCVTGLPLSLAPSLTNEALQTLGKLVVISLALASVVQTYGRLRLFVVFYAACFLLFPVRGALVNYVVGYRVFGRALWNYVYANPNDLAAFLFCPLALSIWLVQTERDWRARWMALGSTGVMLLLLLLTQSRGALIALVVSAAFFLVRTSTRRAVRGIFVTLGLLALVVPFVPSSAWERFQGMSLLSSTETLAQADPEGSAEDRYNIWRVAVQIIASNPIKGVGLGTYEYAHALQAAQMDVPPGAKGIRDTHSTYLHVAAETGFPGLGLFLLMLTGAFAGAERARWRTTDQRLRNLILCQEAGLVGFLVAGVFGSFAALNVLYIQLAVLAASSRIAAKSASPLPAARGSAAVLRTRIA
jgi:O-antigen ligase